MEIQGKDVLVLGGAGLVGTAHAGAAQPGYQPLVENALEYACQGVTTLEEVMRLCGWAE